MKDDSRIVMHDFSRLVDAKHFAISLMDQGIQFGFCPSPISISHPMAIPADERSAIPLDGSEK